MGCLDDCYRENAKNEILRQIRSWQDYQLFTGIVCDALEMASDELVAEKEQRGQSRINVVAPMSPWKAVT